MRRIILAAMLGIAAPLTAAQANDDIALRGMGSFHVGGRLVEITGKPVREVIRNVGGVPSKLDPNGLYQVEQMYVQYFLPKNRKGKLPLLMWHGGGLTGATYETTPDGREGWLNFFVRKGWDVYNADGVERGRSGFANSDVWPTEPIFLTTVDPFERFRIGAGAGSWNADPAKRKLLPGSQFPVAAYDNFVKQIVPRWLSTDSAVQAGYDAMVDKVCPCVVLFHSQAGQFAFRAAQARPDKIKALVAVEPAAPGDKDKAAALKGIPVLMVFGDFIAQDARWPKMRQNDLDYAEAVRAAGGNVDVVNLPEAGIRGNSHMVMMDKNSDEVANVIQSWLIKKGFAD